VFFCLLGALPSIYSSSSLLFLSATHSLCQHLSYPSLSCCRSLTTPFFLLSNYLFLRLLVSDFVLVPLLPSSSISIFFRFLVSPFSSIPFYILSSCKFFSLLFFLICLSFSLTLCLSHCLSIYLSIYLSQPSLSLSPSPSLYISISLILSLTLFLSSFTPGAAFLGDDVSFHGASDRKDWIGDISDSH
jgi:hypothetical protein